MIDFVLGTAFGSVVSIISVVFGAGLVSLREDKK